VGLGNPGRRYASTRHNIGYEALRAFSENHSIRLRRKSALRSRVGVGNIAGKRVVAVAPTTFMNESGDAVARAVGFYGVHPHNLLVLVDDVNLPLGQLRIRQKGSDGGHNGLRSTIARLGTANFPRLRIGIGREESKSLTEFVLGDFSREENTVVEEAVARASEAVELIISEGVSRAMNKYNRSCQRPTEASEGIREGSEEINEGSINEETC
jgi:PTH1 family peptidyl-tRNA hydrolase